MPTLVARRESFFCTDPQEKVRLAHYTSAETAVQIIRSESLWLRNARGMQDFSEVRYGYKIGYDYFEDPTRLNRFVSIFQRADGNPASEGIKLFNNWQAGLDFGTFLACFSAHGSDCEPHGRLSMWRAFGTSNPSVAMILNVPDPYSALPLYCFLSPVSYPSSPKDHWAEYETIIENVKANQELLQSAPSQLITGWIASVLLMHAVSLKHPAFAEETEWRLCYFPSLFPSPHVKKQIHSVRGVPQAIHEVSFKNSPDEGIRGISLPELIHEVKIGPSQHADVIWQALVSALETAGVSDASEKVSYSNIPLRD